MRFVVFLQTFIHLAICIEAKKAFLEIILYEINQEDGRYLIRKREISGIFSNFGTANRAEGDIVQMHPHSLCDASSDSEIFEYGWVGVVKLPLDSSSACHAAEKARSAIRKGATAVIFDISDHPGALQMLNEHSFNGLNQPIVLVKGGDASKLMDIIQREQIARAVIKRGEPDREPFGSGLRDPALLLSGSIFVFTVIALIFCRTKCRKRKQQRSLHNWMLRHSKMKKYEKQKQTLPELDDNTIRCYQSSVSSSGSLCAICLEAFAYGEDLRVLECHHEFHLNCIDLWLKQKRSCPLCNRNFSGVEKEESDYFEQTSFPGTPLSEEHDDNWQSNLENASGHILASGTTRHVESNVNLHSHDPVCEFMTHLSNRYNNSSLRGDLLSGLVDNERSGGGYHIGVARDILHESNESCAPSHAAPNDTLTKEDSRASASQRENHKDSYYLRVEGYPVPHILNEDCESVLPRCTDLVEPVPVSKNYPSNNQRSSVDNVSVLAHLGSIHTIAGRHRSSPLSSDNWNQTDYCSDSSDIRGHTGENRRFLTPCIEYSSSDGAGNLLFQSCSTLEDALAGVPAD